MSDSIENKVNKINEKDIKKGKEFQSLQEAQGQLLQIQEARKNNIQNQRLVSMSEMNNNQILSQAGALVADAQQTQGNQIPQQISPATQNILSKYGMKPQVKVNKSSSVKVTPQNIVYNNNTTNIVNNPPTGPVQGRGIVINTAPKQSNTEKFKVWLSNIFSKQKEAAEIRERDFQKREWSLSRSANKMMRRIESIGNTVAERLDPRKIGSTFSNQLKTLLFLFGINFLSKNWVKVLKGVGKIEGWVKDAADYFGFSEEARRVNTEKGTGFINSLKAAFGGTSNETLGQAIKGLLTESFDYLTLKLSNLFEERGELIKTIKFPDLSLTDLTGSIKSLGTYLSSIFSTFLTGKHGLMSSLGERARDFSVRSSMKYATLSSSERSHLSYGKSPREIWGNNNNLSTGAAALVEKSKRDGSIYKGLLPYSLDEYGNLTDLISSPVAQSAELTRFINEASKYGKISSAGFATGLERLYKYSKKKEFIPVDQEFIKNFFNENELAELQKSNLIRRKKYKLVEIPKTDEELAKEGYKEYWQSFGEERIKSKLRSSVISLAGFDEGGVVDYLNQATSSPYNIFGSKLGSGIKAYVDKKKLEGAAKNRLEFAEEDDPRESVNDKLYNFYEITPEVIEKISNKITKNDKNIKISPENLEFGIAVQTMLEGYSNKGKDNVYDLDFKGTNETFNKVDELEKENEKEEEQFLEEAEHINRAKQNWSEFGDKASSLFNGILDKAYDTDLGKLVSESLKNARGWLSRNDVVKDRALIAMNRLMEEFDLTPEQAAGLVGNWIRESQLETGQHNKAGGGEGAVGIAQWRGPRIRAYEHRLSEDDKEGGAIDYKGNPNNKKLKDSTFEEQLDYAIWELKNTHTTAIKEVKEAKTPYDAADVGFGRYEFAAGLQGGIDEMDKSKKGSGFKSVVAGRSYAKSAYYQYMKSKDPNYEYDWSDFDVPYDKNDETNEQREMKAMEEGKDITEAHEEPVESYTTPWSPVPVNMRTTSGISLKGNSNLFSSNDLTLPKFELNVTGSIETDVKTISKDIKSQSNAINSLALSIQELTLYAASTGNSISVTNQSSKTSVGSLLNEDYTNGIGK